MTMSNNTQELRSFPPVEDAIEFIENIDWEDIQQRTLRGLQLLGIIISFLGGQFCAFGEFLQDLEVEADLNKRIATATEVDPLVAHLNKTTEDTSKTVAAFRGSSKPAKGFGFK